MPIFVRRIIASVIIGLIVVTLRQFSTFAIVCAVAAWLHIWWSKLQWLAPTLALVGVLVVVAVLVFPSQVSTEWLWRGTSLVILMTIVTALGFKHDYDQETRAT